MRHVLKRHRGAIAVPAAMALALMACEADDNGDASPGIEEGEQDEQALLPDGAFGERCQELLVAADVDGVDAGPADDGVDDDAFGDDAGVDDDAGAGVEDDAGTQDDEAFDDGADDGETNGELETEPGADDDATTDEDAAPEDALRQMTVVEALEALPDVDRFTGELAGTLETELDAEGDVTVFVPLDEAFEGEADADADGAATNDAFEDETDADDAATDAGDDVTAGMDTSIDERVIAYHLHPEAALSAQQLVDDESVSTAADDAGDLRVTADGDVVSVDADESTAQVVCANIETQDGTIHVIDEILLPRETDAEADAGTEDDLGTETEDDADADAEGDLDADAEDDGFDS